MMPEGSTGDQNGTKREPKGAKSEPKGAQRAQKGAQSDPKGAKWESKVSQIQHKINIKDKVAKRSRKVSIFGDPGRGFWVHFGSHFHEKAIKKSMRNFIPKKS